MGRSNLQGTPWHYEYAKGVGINNSKNCVFNMGKKCSCKISSNHNKPCVGKLECEEFERSSFRQIPNKQIVTKTNQQPKNNAKIIKKKKVKKTKTPTATMGSTIIIESVKEKEQISLNISDVKNPFYLKELNTIVVLKGIKYKIIKIIK